MGLLTYFCFLGEKKDKKSSVKPADKDKNLKTLHVKLENLRKSSENTAIRSTSFKVSVPFHITGGSRCNVKVMSHGSPIAAAESTDIDYEGGDEHDECLSMKRDISDLDLQAHDASSNRENYQNIERGNTTSFPDVVNAFEFSTSGHVSDPGKGKAKFWASPELQRSCSSLEMRNISQVLFPPLRSKSYEDIQRLAEMHNNEVHLGDAMSPVSIMTHFSADKVMLKKHSSSQILPSRSRRLWWKLFLWSHRNLQSTGTMKQLAFKTKPSALNKQGGYSSDTIEPMLTMEPDKFASPGSLSTKSKNKGKSKLKDQKWDGIYGVSGMWPQHQLVAFPTETSSLARVDEWVKEVSSQLPCKVEDNDDRTEDDLIIFPPSPANYTEKGSFHLARHLPEEILHANSIVQSKNASSTVAHVTGIGLKVVPSISHFSSLRSVNLSGNCIVHITPGSLPKGLHVLDLSRNKISTIEGLRELSRLRVLDLSYNRISRIGQGLSNCMLIKELYLAGNKISDVEGLHRLLKLSILDLSFNKITTAKALGQLVANYSSLIALNLLGNPIQSNIGEDQLRKTVCVLLPKLVFLNKQPINPHKAREVHVSAIARVALGGGGWNKNRNSSNRRKGVSQGSSLSPSVKRSSAGGSNERNRQRSTRQQSASRVKTH